MDIGMGACMFIGVDIDVDIDVDSDACHNQGSDGGDVVNRMTVTMLNVMVMSSS